MVTNRVAVAGVVGGALWTFAMMGSMITHGPGSLDRQGLWLGWSRPNFELLFTPAALCFAAALWALRGRMRAHLPPYFAQASGAAAILLLLFALLNLLIAGSVGVAGQYPDEVTGLSLVGALAQMLGLPLVGLCLALTAFALWRGRLFRAGALLLFAPIALVAIIPWQAITYVPGLVFGIGWVALGAAWVLEGRRAARAAIP
jgi:hypothetical protein